MRSLPWPALPGKRAHIGTCQGVWTGPRQGPVLALGHPHSPAVCRSGTLAEGTFQTVDHKLVNRKMQRLPCVAVCPPLPQLRACAESGCTMHLACSLFAALQPGSVPGTGELGCDAPSGPPLLGCRQVCGDEGSWASGAHIFSGSARPWCCPVFLFSPGQQKGLHASLPPDSAPGQLCRRA